MDLSRTVWRRSSHSGGGGGMCLEVAIDLPDVVAVRDSKVRVQAPAGTAAREWQVLLRTIRQGEF
ncbi:hypothetical protein Sru01_14600 [Sphaerisporangium rufum]|uniref:DUF397 domain-containing protein n=1 Tax=Sphaerisporangium rufum TaxID=1381558 RepID=A0A919R010_9ACTN|nr:DUF397 domain-containing protein [Sphaerisporangium rufum]GII76478.1 hypothetical protein Sru01_14600 [Sphaerisporangium rufum]